MAWTTPRTWVTDELVTAAIMNSHVRDNFNAVPHLLVRKTADETVTSSTTVQNDDALLLTVAASEIWLLRYVLRYTAISAVAGLSFGWTFPTAGQIDASVTWPDGTGTLDCQAISSTSSPSTSIDVGIANVPSGINVMPVDALYVGGANAGTLTFQWAQASSNGTGTVIKANSTLWGCKLA